MFCSNCGKEINNNAKFCSFCGGAINEPETTHDTNNQEKTLPPIPQISNPVTPYLKKKTHPRRKKTGCSQIGCGVFALIFFIVIGLVASVEKSGNNLNKGDTTDSQPQTIKTKTPHKAPIKDGAIYTYPETEKELKEAGFPKMLNKLGLSNIKKANQLMQKAAEKVALNPKCDEVVHVDISDRSERDNLVIYVNAKNGHRFYLTEKEILSAEPALSEQEQLAPLLRRHELMAEEVIKSKLAHPSTYDRHELGIWKSETTANCNLIVIEFSAKNGFGLELTYVAAVQFDKNSNVVGFHMQEKR